MQTPSLTPPLITHNKSSFLLLNLRHLQTQVVALTALLQDRNATVSQPPQETPPGVPPLAHNFPPLTPVSLAPSSAPHFNSLVSGPNPYWGQSSWVPTPTLVETPMLSLEQRLEDMMDHKIAEALSKKSSRHQSIVLEEDIFSLEVMTDPLPRDFE
ncbi:hypothetical protein Adt_33199 [Abeliophyllum distichum]|uniref:Uncharacterized protein n=1 Tax=Abeliophyllum distichum TaxID=126358 RepID=A0ABD1QXI8_9LAMI